MLGQHGITGAGVEVYEERCFCTMSVENTPIVRTKIQSVTFVK
jgi:hypothetical protein